MTLINRFGIFTAAVLVASTPLISDPSAIGRASAENGLVVDNGRASGAALVFEGSTIQASRPSQIRLTNGTHLNLAPGSKAQLFNEHLALNTGVSEVQSGAGFEIDARTLRIYPSNANAVARVDLNTLNQVTVSAVNAPVDVRSQAGVLLARVEPSRTMNFLPQDSGSSSNTFNSDGCVFDAGDSVVLSDASGQRVWELRGSKKANFKRVIGKKAKVVGVIDTSASPNPGATKANKGTGPVQVITVAGVRADKDQTGADCSKLATVLGASAAAGAGAAAAAGAATASSVAAAAGAATAAGVAIPAAAASTAAIAGGVAAAGAAAAAGSAAAVATTGSSS